MRREYYVSKKKNKVVIYGIGIALLLGSLRWVKIGTITKDETDGTYSFNPSWWNICSLSEKAIRIIDIEMDKLRKQ